MTAVHDLPEFQALRKRRAWLSWGLSLPLAAAYIALGVACVYARDWLGAPIASDPYFTRALGLALGLIAASVVAALVYARVSNRELEDRREALLAKLDHE